MNEGCKTHGSSIGINRGNIGERIFFANIVKRSREKTGEKVSRKRETGGASKKKLGQRRKRGRKRSQGGFRALKVFWDSI